MIQNVGQPQKQQLTSVETGVVQVLCAADENYAMSLGVTLRTAAEHLRINHVLKAFVIDGGISAESWAKIESSVSEFEVEIERIVPDKERVAHLSTSHHISHTAYFRLLAAEWLPSDVTKVIYLDSDLLIQDDLVELWELDEENYYCWAVPDIACPYVDARQAKVNYAKSSPYLAALSPIPNYRELGLDGSAAYFNSGIMVMHLSKWRDDGISTRLLECLRDNEQHVWCWDQYALNVVFAGRWGQLPLRWNQGAHAFEFPSLDHAPVCREQFAAMIEKPAVIHYTTEWKPWDFVSAHPSHQRFFEKLDETAWAGWRPEKPPFSVKRIWNSMALAVMKFSVINYRKLASKFQS
jgi:lipopolysaccharide biosynthesis glycosyltransferase